MKNLMSSLLLIIFVCKLQAQPGWTWQNPLPQGNPLHSISIVSHCGWAVGPMGTAIWTCDYGETWQKIDLGTQTNLNSVYLHDDLMAFMVGDNGLILFVMEDQINNAFEVTQHFSPTQNNLNAVTSNLNGCPWAAGDNGTVIRATDLWDTWEEQSTTYQYDLFSMDNIECTEAIASGPDGLVLYTTDLGNTWINRSVLTTWDLYSVSIGQFDNIRVAGQAGNIWFTDDKGITWTEQHQEPGYQLYDIVNIGTNTAYAVGSDETILESIDHGASWTKPTTDKKLVFTPFYDATEHYGQDQVWVVGHHGVILKNSGIETEFKVQNEGWLEWIHAIEFVNESEGWAVGGDYDPFGEVSRGVVLHTEDGGETWEEQLNLNTLLTDVDFVNENKGWAIGRDGKIIYTDNGGIAWMNQTSPITGLLTSVCFVDEENGWIVSRDNWGEIIHTSNGGATWTTQENDSDNPLHDVYFIDDQHGWAVGLDTTIIRTWDGGQDWHGVANYPVGGCRYASVFFIDAMNGWAVGTNGRIVRSQDGGANWEEMESGTTLMLESVYFLDHENGWAVGDQGIILRTVDGGQQWFKQQSGVSHNFLASVYFTDLAKGWIAGEGGTIIHSENGGFEHDPGAFVQNGLGIPILDNEETSSTIEVDVSGVITKGFELTGIEVYFDTILHSRVSDLEIILAHEGVAQTLVYHVNDEGENFLWTTLKDGAAHIISDGLAPFSGEYSPYSPLEVFNGTNPNGDWTLTIYDNEAGNTGTLMAWGLKPYFNKTTAVKENKTSTEQAFQLKQNIPNPFQKTTSISWNSKITGTATLKVFNINGQVINILVDESIPAGEQSVQFDGSVLSPGIYYYQLMIGEIVESRKMVKTK